MNYWQHGPFPNEGSCPCGGIILADCEDWPVPICYECYIKTPEYEADCYASRVGEKHGNKGWVIRSHRDAFLAGAQWSAKQVNKSNKREK